ncbi:MAG: hypothetical protein AAGB51_07450 [Planctomycetota bacterium]
MQTRMTAAIAACAIAVPALAASPLDVALENELASAGSFTAGDIASQNYPAYPVLKFDLNQLGFESSEELSESFTGTISVFDITESVLNSVEGSGTPFGSFTEAGNGGVLDSLTARLTFDNGDVTGGSFTFSNDLGDELSIDVAAAGQIRETVGSAFFVDGLVATGNFTTSDQFFGDVDLSEFYSNGGLLSEALIGDLTLHRVAENGSVGTLDAEIVVLVPSPGTAVLCGFGALAASRRRR